MVAHVEANRHLLVPVLSSDGVSRANHTTHCDDAPCSSALHSSLKQSCDDSQTIVTAAIHSTTTPSKKRLRSVRFHMDENDEVLCSVHVYAAIPAQCRLQVYWSKLELKQLRRERKACEATYSLCDEYVFSIERLLDSPLKCQLIQSCDLTEQQAVATLSQASHVRGLESRLSALIQWHHRWAVNAVLRRHSQLRRDGVPHPEVLLRALSEQVSECNRDFAAKLAQGDRLEALKVYQEC